MCFSDPLSQTSSAGWGAAGWAELRTNSTSGDLIGQDA